MITAIILAAMLAPPSLDYDFYKSKVQPIFLQKRPGHARCIVCHEGGTSAFRLEKIPKGGSWSEEQTRKNFETASALVVPGDPANSPLLKHPLAQAAGGDRFHSGGRQFETQNDSSYKILVRWVKSGK